jgi:putative protease
VTVRQAAPAELSPGDGLVFRNPGNSDDDVGFPLNTQPRQEKGIIRLTVPRPVQRGALVFLTSSTALTAKAHRIMNTPPSFFLHPFPIDLCVRVSEDGRVALEGMIDAGGEKKVPVLFSPDIRLSPALTRPLTRDQFEARMRKTGGTPFVVRKFSLDYGGGMFAPVAELNRMRREFLVSAEKALIRESRPPDTETGPARARMEELARRFSTPGNPRRHPAPKPPALIM